MVFCLPDLILPIELKVSEHSLTPILLALDSVQHFINNLQGFTTLPNITNNLGSSGGKSFFCKIQDGGPLKLKKNVQRPNTRAIPVAVD